MNKLADALARAVQRGLVSESAAGKVTQQLGLKSRFLRRIGQGYEGVAQLRTHDKEGLTVAKIHNTVFDKNFWPSTFELKQKVWEKVNGNPEFAGYLGREPGRYISYHEYVKHAPLPVEIAKKLWALKNLSRKGSAHAAAGRHLHDVYWGNVINGKIVDFIPSYPPTKADLSSNQRIIDGIKARLNDPAAVKAMQRNHPNPKLIERAAYVK